jgi:hypothetical protein
MWKLNSDITAPHIFTYRENTPYTFISTSENTTINLSDKAHTLRYLSRVLFLPIDDTLFNNIDVHINITKLNTFPKLDFSQYTLENCYTVEEDLYISSDIYNLIVNTDLNALDITLTYKVSNVTNISQIAAFSTPIELENIYIYTSDNNKYPVDNNYLTKLNFTRDMIIDYVYKYRIYTPSSNQQYVTVLNNTVHISTSKLLVFPIDSTVSLSTDLAIYMSNYYKRVYTFEQIDTAILYLKKHFFMTDKYIFLIN